MKALAQRQKGVALIVALLVVALATVLIAGLLDRGELAGARTRNQLREAQAQAYALGLEAYAAKVLTQDQAQGSGIDAADSPWAVPLPPTAVPAGTISAVMTDLDGRFNLNNLDPAYDTQQTWRNKFTWLLQALKLDSKLADDVVAWMSAAASTSAASDAYYLAQPVPYRAARRGFAHVSELRLVHGIDSDIYRTLSPYVSALPPGTTINVNTASVPVLMTLAQNMTAEMAQPIWQQGHAHFHSLADLTGMQPQLQFIDCSACYSWHSAYFVARGQITLDGLPFEFRSLIERRTGGADGGVRVLQRSRGSD
jgi:general secretion pathway protein K